MKRFLEILVISSLILDILVRNFKVYFPEYFYYKAEAIMIFSIASFLLNVKDNWITFLIFSLSINNLSDELFFNPLELGWIELAFTIAVLIIIKFRYAVKR